MYNQFYLIMKNRILLLAMAAVFAVAGFTRCSDGDAEVMVVASETRTCYGVMKQQCMLVKGIDAASWEFFYGNIEGFEYEPGYEYVLKVKKSVVENPPQDASSVKYELVKVLSREQKTSEGMPQGIE